jgi:hypothetical protein
LQSIEFRRRIDTVRYHFSSAGTVDGHATWKRDDLDLWVVRRADQGWVVVDASDLVLSRPWNVLPSSQGDLPPEGEWVSKKADRSYVYDVVFV